MAIVDIGPARDTPALTLPHSKHCRKGRVHPDTHCYSEQMDIRP